MKELKRVSQVFGEGETGLIATIIFIDVVALFVIFAAKFPQLYILATYEDLPGEWAQVFFFAATLGGSLFLVRHPNPHRFFFALLALACFYVVGEEMSWGQRLFAFESPEFFSAIISSRRSISIIFSPARWQPGPRELLRWALLPD